MSKKILVVGSVNMDLLVRTKKIPEVGETVLGEELLQIPGGKGANQAVAMGKLEEDVVFLGKVGDDSFGEELLKSMEDAGVDTSHILREQDTSSGVAVINVDDKANNNIVVISGANWKVDEDYLLENRQAFKDSDAVVLQLEIPINSVKKALEIGKDHDKIRILNPAPASKLDDEILKMVDILIPNEIELGQIAGMEIEDESSVVEAANKLLAKGIEEVVVTLGSRGVMHVNKDGYKSYPAYKIRAVDTTGAGDSFIGGFTASYINNGNIEEAIEVGQKVAALTCQKIGAQSSLPSKREVENFEI